MAIISITRFRRAASMVALEVDFFFRAMAFSFLDRIYRIDGIKKRE